MNGPVSPSWLLLPPQSPVTTVPTPLAPHWVRHLSTAHVVSEWVLSKFKGTSTPKGSYRAKTGDNDCNVNWSHYSLSTALCESIRYQAKSEQNVRQGLIPRVGHGEAALSTPQSHQGSKLILPQWLYKFMARTKKHFLLGLNLKVQRPPWKNTLCSTTILAFWERTFWL